MEPWMERFTKQLEEKVTGDKIAHYQTVIMPQVIADFMKMLNDTPAGQIVREEYRMEDSSLTIRLEGKRIGNRCEITKTEVV